MMMVYFPLTSFIKEDTMSIQRISIISIPVSDQDAARTFYTDKLGFEVVRDNPMGDGNRWVELKPPHAETSITLVTWFEDMPPGSLDGMVLETGDLSEEHRQLVDRGLKISEIDEAPWGRFATFMDPDGNGWVLQESAT